MKLFSEPFDLGEVDRLLREDDFLSLAHLMTGRAGCWRAALDQVAVLMSLFEDAGRDCRPIYSMVSVLVDRAGTLPETAKLLEEVAAKLNLLPEYFDQIRAARLRDTDPQAWQREQNRKWAEARKVIPEVINVKPQTG